MVKHVKLSNGEFALCDDEDYDLLSRHIWARVGRFGYPAIVQQTSDGMKKWFIYMHRIVMPGYKESDHINRNVLDVQKHNLRPMTTQLNSWNSGKMCRASGKRKCTSKYKGVMYAPLRGVPRWLVSIRHVAKGMDKKTGKIIRVGYFFNEDEAARAYNIKIRELRGEWAYINEIPEQTATMKE